MIRWLKELWNDWSFRDPAGQVGWAMLCMCFVFMGLMAFAALRSKPLPDVTAMEWSLSNQMGMDCTCKEWRK